MDINLKHIFLFSLILLSCALVSNLCIWFGLSLDRFQFFAFPVFLFGILFTLRGFQSAPSLMLVILPLGLWILMAFSVDQMLPFGDSSKGIKISYLSDDPSFEKIRSLLRNYKKFERRKNALPLSSLEERFIEDSDFKKWLSSNENVNLLIGGNSEWLELFPRLDYLSLLANLEFQSVREEVSSSSVFKSYLEADELGESFLVNDRASNTEYLMLKGPSSVSLPTKDQLLAFSFISWFGKALSSARLDLDSTILTYEQVFGFEEPESKGHALKPLTYYYLRRIVESHGLWASNTPRGYISYLLGTSLILKYHELGYLDELDLCAEILMGEASARVGRHENPELYVAIFNNAAVGKILSTRDEEIMYQAKALLWRAANTRGGDGNLVEGATVAYTNLLQLERSGAVPW